MKLTTRGRYAVTAMLDLAIHGDAGPVALGEIAGRQAISLAYLEQLFACLRRDGLVTSTRGPGGGYCLNRPAAAIAVADVIAAVGEDVDATRCGGARNCQDDEVCLTHELWAELTDHVDAFLRGVTIGDLSQRRHVRRIAARQRGRAGGEIPLRMRAPASGSHVGG